MEPTHFWIKIGRQQDQTIIKDIVSNKLLSSEVKCRPVKENRESHPYGTLESGRNDIQVSYQMRYLSEGSGSVIHVE